MSSKAELEQLTVSGLRDVALRLGVETRGVRQELMDRLVEHFEKTGWPEHLLRIANIGDETTENTTRAKQGQMSEKSTCRPSTGVLSEAAPPEPGCSRGPIMDAGQMQAVVQAVLQALERGQPSQI
ncbi:unnamed protein product [Lasius platythorax]|uniref:SAP domain-containing protein n=1 Tax=Lasius platythorax TaxID=488582 RepID=A0AAV2NX42_9HYME